MGLFDRLILAAATTLAFAGPAFSQKAALTTFLEPNHIITRYQHNEFAEKVRARTGGKINIEVFAGGALVPAAGTMQGIASGVAQMGIYAANYTPSQLPVMSALGDLGFIKPDPYVQSFAYADFSMNEKIGYGEWRKNDVIFGAGMSTPIYHYMCKGVHRTLAELKGKKTRMPGGGYARFGDTIGLVSVNLPASEIYTGLERGALDCVCADVTHLQSGSSIGELVKSIVMLKLPPSFSTAGIMYNPTFWKGLTDEQRRILLEEGGRALVRLHIAFAKETDEALAWAKTKGIQLIEPEPALQKAYDDFVAKGIGGLAETTRDRFKVQNPEAIFKSYESYLDKWEKLLAGVDRKNEEAVYAVLKANLIDKVDVSKYGME